MTTHSSRWYTHQGVLSILTKRNRFHLVYLVRSETSGPHSAPEVFSPSSMRKKRENCETKKVLIQLNVKKTPLHPRCHEKHMTRVPRAVIILALSLLYILKATTLVQASSQVSYYTITSHFLVRTFVHRTRVAKYGTCARRSTIHEIVKKCGM